MTIGKFLERLRKEKGLTQAQVAEVLGVSDRTVSAWETGARLPDILALSDLAAFYGVTADEILHGERKTLDSPVPEAVEELTDIADNSDAAREEALDKRRIFSAKATATGGILDAALAAIVFSAFFSGYAFRNQLLFVLLSVGGVLALVICAGFLAALKKIADDVPLALRVKQKILTRRILFRVLYTEAGIMAVIALFILIALATPLFDYMNDFIALVMILYFAAAFALCYAGSFLLHRDIKRLGDERAIQISERNRRRLVRCYIFGCIPVFLAIATIIVCGFWQPYIIEPIYSSTQSGIVEYLQTVEVNEWAEKYGLVPGTYVLNVSAADPDMIAKPQPVADGFYCRFYSERCEVIWKNEEETYIVAEGWAVAVGNMIAYDFRYGIDYGMNCSPPDYKWISVRSYSRGVYETADGYELCGMATYDIKNLGFLIAACLVAGDILICTAICLLKYKKIPIETE